jgi:hypothetical protein
MSLFQPLVQPAYSVAKIKSRGIWLGWYLNTADTASYYYIYSV